MPYLSHFSLKAHPFSPASYSEFCYIEDEKQDLIEAIKFAINRNAGLVKITGRSGTGKSFLGIRAQKDIAKLENVRKNDIILIQNPTDEKNELIKTICEHFDIEYKNQHQGLSQIKKELVSIQERQQKFVLIIDDAQKLKQNGLDDVLSLNNLENNQQKLAQIVLIGSNLLNEHLSNQEQSQLYKRILFNFEIKPVSNTSDYIEQRISYFREVGTLFPIFSKDAIKVIEKNSFGNFQTINSLCDKAMLCAFGEKKAEVTKEHAKKAVYETFFDKSDNKKQKTILSWLFLFVIIFAIILITNKATFKQKVKSSFYKKPPIEKTIIKQSDKHPIERTKEPNESLEQKQKEKSIPTEKKNQNSLEIPKKPNVYEIEE